MNVPPDPKDNQFASWQTFFKALDAQLTGKVYNDEIQKAKNQKPGRWQAFGFHAAAIDRLLEHGGLNPALSDEQRRACLQFAENGIGIVESIWAHEPETIAKLQKAVAASKQINDLFGTPTARELAWARLNEK